MKLVPLLTIPLALAIALSSCKSPSEKQDDQQETPTSPEATTSVPMTKLTPSSLNVVPLEGYFVKNTVSTEQESTLVLISTQAEFDQSFGIAKTMTNTITPIDFTQNKVVAIFTKPSDLKTNIQLDRASVHGEILTANYNIDQGEKQSFKSSALILFTVPHTVTTISSK